VTPGKTLLARQFVEMTRLRVDGLLSAFHSLVDVGRDHAFIETEAARYVCQPMESLHLLLVTDKSSNIFEDLGTLQLLARVSEEVVLKHALDIVFAFDEAVSCGHRQIVTPSQVECYTKMDSHEEKHHHVIEKRKMDEARELAKQKQRQLDQRMWEAEGWTFIGSDSDLGATIEQGQVLATPLRALVLVSQCLLRRLPKNLSRQGLL